MPRYIIEFGHGNTSLTPSFITFKQTDTQTPLVPPVIYEFEDGAYFFDWAFLSTDPSIYLIVDGGPTVSPSTNRYPSRVISPKDAFVDQPISQVKADVLGNDVSWPIGTKGYSIEQVGAVMTRLGAPANGTVVADIAAAIAATQTVEGKVDTANTRIGSPPGGSSVIGELDIVKTDIGALDTAVGANTAAVSGMTAVIGTPASGTLSSLTEDTKTAVTDLTTTVGTPAYGSVVADVSQVSADVLALSTKVGDPGLSPVGQSQTIAKDVAITNSNVMGVTTNINALATQESVDTLTTRVGTPPVGSSVSNEVASVKASTALIKAATDYLYLVGSGHWKIDRASSTLTFYDGSNNVLKRFALTDDTGTPNADKVYERTPL